ncbi:TadE/TadG family type IV pilus assembly protein [Phenylobacterium sp.]|uniref:TadE/TadG family type IV pilus assembly protein n=1 Tax=Phenylobacterium sp. TaxID=1871053 RepID=UPI0035AEA1AC
MTSLKRCDSGAAAVEFALLVPLFLGLLLGAIQHGIAGMVSASFDDAVLAASRHIRTGQASGAGGAAAFKALICEGMFDPPPTCLARLRVNVRPLATFAQAAAAQDQARPEEDRFVNGGANAIMLVTATYDWPMFTPFLGDGFTHGPPGTARMTAHMLFKNEPFR